MLYHDHYFLIRRVTGPKGHWSERYRIKLCTGRGTVVVWALQLFVDLMTLENAL